MKLIRRKDKDVGNMPFENKPLPDLSLAVFPKHAAWKVLIADDEHDVHTVTKLSLKNFGSDDKPIEFIEAMSDEEARELKLRTTKAYRNISIINCIGLEKILNAAPKLYRLQQVEEFIERMLIQIIGLCHLVEDNLILIHAGTGRFASLLSRFFVTLPVLR